MTKYTEIKVTQKNSGCFNRTSRTFAKRWVQKHTVRRRRDAKRCVLDPIFISHFRRRIPYRDSTTILAYPWFHFFTLNLRHPVYIYIYMCVCVCSRWIS